MKAYHLKVIDEDGLRDHFAGSQIAAKHAAKKFQSEEGVNVSVHETEIPTSKNELLEFLNVIAGTPDC